MGKEKVAASTSGTSNVEVSIMKVEQGVLRLHMVGTTPLILNRMSEKAKHTLLLPSGKKSASEKASTLKHEPLLEFQSAPYRIRDPQAPALLALPATAFKGAMRTAALDIPGAKKAQIGRLVYVLGDYIPVYGIPKLFMSVTRSADINKTPDIRTRAILATWAAVLDVRFMMPLMREHSILNLAAAAGMFVGVGDWRPEKGAGNYGQFRVVGSEDPEYTELVASGGRAAQEDAMDNPEPYDLDTEDLLAWHKSEVQRRGFKIA